MSPSLDFNLLPLQRQDGQDSKSTPGLLMVTPPRRAARGREMDLLVLYLSMTGSAPLPDTQQEQVLTKLAQLFYKTSGSVTQAMRTIADHLNQLLLERNLNSSNSGRQGIGLLTMAVMKNERLTLGQCGPVHAYLVKPQNIQHLHDPQTSGRGLGLARSVLIRYFQAELEPNDVLVLSPQPPSTWKTATMQTVHGQGLDSLRRKLLSQAGPNVDALVIYVQGGTGKMRMLHVKPAAVMVQPRPAGAEAPTAASTPEAADELPAPAAAPATESEAHALAEDEKTSDAPAPLITAAPPAKPAAPTAPPVRTPPPADGSLSPEDDYDFLLPVDESEPEEEAGEEESELPQQSAPASVERPPASTVNATAGAPAAQANRTAAPQKVIGRTPLSGSKFKTASKPAFAPLSRLFSSLGSKIRSFFRGVLGALAALLKRILPDESLFTIPASTMAFTAIAVAVVIATAGGMMYYQRGRALQYQTFFDHALAAAEAVAQESKPLELRTGWEATLYYLDQADEYKVTAESLALRNQAQRALDELDYTYRLSFQEAIIGGLSPNANIVRMVATNSELYLLNANGGNILRAILTGANYEIDPNFQCSPDPTFGNIVDIIPLPANYDDKAYLLAIDTHGNLMACFKNAPPEKRFPAPPHTTWKSPTRFTLDSGNLYVLDPQTNGVWIYRGMNIDSPPHLYFGEQVPPMRDVIDLAVNRDELYLLHEDGHLTTCQYSGLREAPTRCEEPARYSDPRPGRTDGPLILDARFSQILYTPPPDASIYMLDPINQSIYHFSLRLNFQRQFRSVTKLPGDTATAFAVSPNRMIFVAAGSQVYFSVLP